MSRRDHQRDSNAARMASPRVLIAGFIVTNMTRPNRAVARLYKKHGRAVDQGRKMAWLSCRRFRSNEVRPARGRAVVAGAEG